MYRYSLIDPRPDSRKGELEALTSTTVLGVEVTVPELAQACSLGNIDPQHSGGDPDTAAVEAAVTWPLPPADATLATVRPDADAAGAMAILTLRRAASDVLTGRPVADRVAAIAAADKRAPTFGPDSQTVTPVQALQQVCMDRGRPLTQKVDTARQWLASGEFTGQSDAVQQVLAARPTQQQWRELLDSVRQYTAGRVAVITTTSRFGVQAGYHYAPVVVAVDPQFQTAQSEPHRKITICQDREGYVDLASVRAELQAREPGWGGSPTIVGSPQGESTEIDVDDLVEVVTRHLT